MTGSSEHLKMKEGCISVHLTHHPQAAGCLCFKPSKGESDRDVGRGGRAEIYRQRHRTIECMKVLRVYAGISCVGAK